MAELFRCTLVVSPLLAPWPDASGAKVHAGDLIRHPSGDTARVEFDPKRNGKARWRAVYRDGESLFLGRQIGPKGRAVVIPPKGEQ